MTCLARSITAPELFNGIQVAVVDGKALIWLVNTWTIDTGHLNALLRLYAEYVASYAVCNLGLNWRAVLCVCYTKTVLAFDRDRIGAAWHVASLTRHSSCRRLNCIGVHPVIAGEFIGRCALADLTYAVTFERTSDLSNSWEVGLACGIELCLSCNAVFCDGYAVCWVFTSIRIVKWAPCRTVGTSC